MPQVKTEGAFYQNALSFKSSFALGQRSKLQAPVTKSSKWSTEEAKGTKLTQVYLEFICLVISIFKDILYVAF